MRSDTIGYNRARLAADMGVVHRDLKPENFLLSCEGDSAVVKVTDFGLSVFYRAGDVLDDLARALSRPYFSGPFFFRPHFRAWFQFFSPACRCLTARAVHPPFVVFAAGGLRLLHRTGGAEPELRAGSRHLARPPAYLVDIWLISDLCLLDICDICLM